MAKVRLICQMEFSLQSKNNHCVYCLIDPRNGLPFYVGKGKGTRMYSHEKMVSRGIIPHNNLFLFRKIKKIQNVGLSIIYKKIYEGMDDASALSVEMDEIKRIGRSNLGLGPLCNLTDGGDGNSGKVVSEKTKCKMSLTAKERLKDPSKHPMFHKHHSKESKKKMSAYGKLRFSDPEERKRTAETTRKGMFSSGYVDRVSKEISMVSPEGITITTKNISQFCRDHNLQNGNLYKVLRGKMKTHRGWSLPK